MQLFVGFFRLLIASDPQEHNVPDNTKSSHCDHGVLFMCHFFQDYRNCNWPIEQIQRFIEIRHWSSTFTFSSPYKTVQQWCECCYSKQGSSKWLGFLLSFIKAFSSVRLWASLLKLLQLLCWHWHADMCCLQHRGWCRAPFCNCFTSHLIRGAPVSFGDWCISVPAFFLVPRLLPLNLKKYLKQAPVPPGCISLSHLQDGLCSVSAKT